MKNKSGLFLFAGAVFVSVIAALLTISMIRGLQEETTVWVVTSEVPANREITKADIQQTVVPKVAVIGRNLSEEEIIGGFTATKLLAGQPIVEGQITDSVGGEITAKVNAYQRIDLRAISIPVDQINGFGGKLQIGDTVDVVYEEISVSNIPIIDVINDQNGKSTGIVLLLDTYHAKQIIPYKDKVALLVRPQF